MLQLPNFTTNEPTPRHDLVSSAAQFASPNPSSAVSVTRTKLPANCNTRLDHR